MKKATWDIDIVLQHHGTLMLKLWLQAAKRSGLTKEESRVILKEATAGNYLHLISTLQKYSTPSNSALEASELSTQSYTAFK